MSDTDRGASALLAYRHPGVPNLGDLTAVDWESQPEVDVITAGWPCQPFSIAGQRRGTADERAIWPGVARAVRLARPRYVVLENVSDVVPLGELARVVRDLDRLGYVGSWTCLRASDVGAPHQRRRCFVVASHPGRPGPGLWEDRRAVGGVGGVDEGEAGHGARQEPGDGGASADEAERFGWGPYERAVRRWEQVLGRRAPRPIADGELSPLFTEWMMGLPAGWVTAVPGLSANAQRKLLGNGVVPQQARAAVRMLCKRAPAGQTA